MTRAERIAIVRPILRHFGGKASRWTQHARAKTLSGHITHACADDAARWCLIGAADAVGINGDVLRKALRLELESMALWNDAPGRTFADVQRKLKAACK